MAKTEMLSTLLPFSGFYYSWHDAAFDCQLESEFGGADLQPWASALQSRMHDAVDWRAAQTDYAKAYADQLAGALHIAKDDFEFEEMVSPREYNFTTDRLFAKISFEFLQSCMVDADVRAMLDTVAAEMFTSRSGFISSYSPDVANWGEDLREWDYNQRGALLKAACNVRLADGEEFSQENEFSLCEDFSGNGDIGNWMYAHDGGMGNRLYRVHSYLETRAAR